jgi:hypothetical protein
VEAVRSMITIHVDILGTTSFSKHNDSFQLDKRPTSVGLD